MASRSRYRSMKRSDAAQSSQGLTSRANPDRVRGGRRKVSPTPPSAVSRPLDIALDVCYTLGICVDLLAQGLDEGPLRTTVLESARAALSQVRTARATFEARHQGKGRTGAQRGGDGDDDMEVVGHSMGTFHENDYGEGEDVDGT